jgi:hypothetical protein
MYITLNKPKYQSNMLIHVWKQFITIVSQTSKGAFPRGPKLELAG